MNVHARITHSISDQEAKELYSYLAQEPFYEALVQFITSGPSELLLVSKGAEGVIDEINEFLGPYNVEAALKEAPDSLRARYGTSDYKNAIDSARDAGEVAR
ncbi:unnamed protein product [Protopolystoma xenopodis]|uniref:Nucleoside diphosphate kinase-like domain-containing protein n=1 Tax=Protopolystoma xenopodis TaxID=117903 RepID=A0A448X6R3_9PLAT|nr:unnamed protein product [Protopolystoma xenopodis]